MYYLIELIIKCHMFASHLTIVKNVWKTDTAPLILAILAVIGRLRWNTLTVGMALWYQNTWQHYTKQTILQFTIDARHNYISSLCKITTQECYLYFVSPRDIDMLMWGRVNITNHYTHISLCIGLLLAYANHVRLDPFPPCRQSHHKWLNVTTYENVR